MDLNTKLPKRSFMDMIPKDSFIDFQKFKSKNTSKEVLVFDTNFLFVPFEFRVELISEVRRILGKDVSFVILNQTLNELINIENKKTKNKKFLPLIATFIKVYNVSILTNLDPSISFVDDVLFSLPTSWIIATNDKELKKRLWSVPVKVIFMRQKSYLDIK